MMQRLDKFILPKNFRGKNKFIVQLWWIVQSLFFNTSPQFMFGWRRFLLRLFGSKIGCNVKIRPSVKVTYPWKLIIGSYSWIGDDVVLYNLGNINIGTMGLCCVHTIPWKTYKEHENSAVHLYCRYTFLMNTPTQVC